MPKSKRPPVRNVDQFTIEWTNSDFILSFENMFGEQGTYLKFPPEDIEALRDALSTALVKYKRGESSD